jgi:hypothetical protein
MKEPSLYAADDLIDIYLARKGKVYYNRYNFFDRYNYMKKLYNRLFFDMTASLMRKVKNRHLRQYYQFIIELNRCVRCRQQVVLQDPFINIRNEEEVDITWKLCLNCIIGFTKCSCGVSIGGPWEIFYTNYKCYDCQHPNGQEED